MTHGGLKRGCAECELFSLLGFLCWKAPGSELCLGNTVTVMLSPMARVGMEAENWGFRCYLWCFAIIRARGKEVMCKKNLGIKVVSI